MVTMTTTRAVKLHCPQTGEIREIATAGVEYGEPWEYSPFRSACEVLAAFAELTLGYVEPTAEERHRLAALLPSLARMIAVEEDAGFGGLALVVRPMSFRLEVLP